MAMSGTPQTNVKGFLGETPRPRIPHLLTSIVRADGMGSVSRPQHGFYEPVSHAANRSIAAGYASEMRRPYNSVPRWPNTSDDNEPYPSAKLGQSASNPIHGNIAKMQASQYDASSTVQRSYEHVPMYASTSRLHPPPPKPFYTPCILNHETYQATSTLRDGTSTRTLMDDQINMSASRMLRNVEQSQEVVLFALHPQTIIRPLRRAVRQAFNGILEWLLQSMQRRGMPRNVALAKLSRTRWFSRLFDYVSVERMLNIFKMYLSQSDALAVPRDLVDVYDAFSHEINRYYLSESIRPNTTESRSNRAFVVGGIDFTEETLKSITRSIDPRPFQSNQTPQIAPPLSVSGGSSTEHTGVPLQVSPSDSVHNTAPASKLAFANRSYFHNKDNLSVIGSLVTRLQSLLKLKEKELEELRREESDLTSKLLQRKKVLRRMCLEFTSKRINAEYKGFRTILADIQKQSDLNVSSSGTSKIMEEINAQMRSIRKSAAFLSRM